MSCRWGSWIPRCRDVRWYGNQNTYSCLCRRCPFRFRNHRFTLLIAPLIMQHCRAVCKSFRGWTSGVKSCKVQIRQVKTRQAIAGITLNVILRADFGVSLALVYNARFFLVQVTFGAVARIGITLGSLWSLDHSEGPLCTMSLWGHFEVASGSCYDHFGITAGSL